MTTAVVACFILIADMYVYEVYGLDTHTVTTSFGKVVGRIGEVTIDNKVIKVQSYLGIRYAEVPTDTLRYKRSVPRTFPQNSVINATQKGDMCIQLNTRRHSVREFRESEDCLYLNVYVPHHKNNSAQRRSVIIWIHGGRNAADFRDGASNYVKGDVLSVVSGVIVVTFNYRLSFWGFFSPGTSQFDNNRGLWDQQLVIKWVRENIQAFGGNRNRVTLLGQDQGAVSAILQSFYKGNRGLFQKIIAEDGTPFGLSNPQLYPFISNNKNIPELVNKLGCSSKYMRTSAKCLYKVDSGKVRHMLELNSNIHLLPVIDQSFISSPLGEMLDMYQPEENDEFDLQFTDVDILFGSRGHCNMLYNNAYNIKDKLHDFRSAINTITRRLYPRSSLTIARVIAAVYSDIEIPVDQKIYMERFIRFINDVITYIPITRTATAHAENSVGGVTFLYHNRHEARSCVAEMMSNSNVPRGDLANRTGGTSKDEQWNDLSSNRNTMLPLKLMRWWGTFAAYGNPIIDEDSEWIQFDPSNQTYMDVSSGAVLSLADDPITDFWLDILPTLINETFTLPKAIRDHTDGQVPRTSKTRKKEEPDISQTHANAVIIALAVVIIVLCAGLAVLGGFILCLKVKQARLRKE